ncbi:MAG: hypothetical protein AABO57_14365 [Acidobacteriota bacterium]
MPEDYTRIEVYSGVTVDLREVDGHFQLRHVESQSTAPSEWQTLTKADILNYAGRCNAVSDWLIKHGVNPTKLLEESRLEYSGVKKGTPDYLEVGKTYLAALKAMINIKTSFWRGTFTVLSNTTLEQQAEAKKADDALIEDMKKRVDEITKELKEYGFQSPEDHQAAC